MSDLSKFENTSKFYLDPKNPGIVKGGWFDEMGGILVGLHAEDVCFALNEVRAIADEAVTIKENK